MSRFRRLSPILAVIIGCMTAMSERSALAFDRPSIPASLPPTIPVTPSATSSPLSAKPFLVGTESDFPPYTIIDGDGHPSGFSIELLETIAKKMNIKLKFIVSSWTTIRGQLETGETAIISHMARSPARAKTVDFSDTHSIGYDAIFVPDGQTAVRSETDLVGRKIIVQKGDFAYDWLHEKNDAEYRKTGRELYSFVYSSSVVEAFNLLQNGGGDAYVGSQLTALAVLQRYEPKTIHPAEKPMMTGYSREYAFAVRKGERELLNRLDEGLKSVVASGEYNRLHDKWFAQLDPAIRERERKAAQLQQLAFGLGVSILIALASIAMVVVFRREVNRKARSLAESELRFRNLVTNLPGVVFSGEFTGDSGEEPALNQFRFTFISDFVDKITGHGAPAFLGTQPRSLMQLVHPEDRGELVRTIAKNVRDRVRTEVEFRMVARVGETRWIQAQVSPPTPNPVNGRVVMNGILFDISTTKNIATLFAQQQSKMAASARLSALGEMAGGIAHEINNPLAIISLRAHQLTQLAKKGAIPPDDARLVATGIETTAHRISKIVRSLQKVSRESDGDPCESVTIREIIEETFELCYQRMLNNGIRVDVEDLPKVNSEDMRVECRRVQISQVLINILNNAFDAVLSVPNSAKPKAVRLKLSDLGDTVELTIANSGPPISPELEHKIFQPFFTTKGVGKGTGLGLSISKGLIESHGGEIFVATVEGETRFVIILPKRQPSARTATARRATRDALDLT